MKLKQFFEKISLHNHQGFGIYSARNLDFRIAYDGKRGNRERTGKTCYLPISVLRTTKL